MTNAKAPYGRLERILARLDFTWRVSGSQLEHIAQHGLWSTRFRPGGPHGLWIAGHLAFYERGALKLYRGLDRHPLGDWKDLFGNGSPCLDDLASYPAPEYIHEKLTEGRAAVRESIAAFSPVDLDRPVANERLAIRDMQSQIEFLIWHDSHHAAQLGAIVNSHKDGSAG